LLERLSFNLTEKVVVVTARFCALRLPGFHKKQERKVMILDYVIDGILIVVVSVCILAVTNSGWMALGMLCILILYHRKKK
jgi:hypothetical protein